MTGQFLMAIFRAVSQRDYTASNGNTVRVGFDSDGNVRINARKGDHNQSVSVLAPADAIALAEFLATGGSNV